MFVCVCVQDFSGLFSDADAQCAEVKLTTNRAWYRLVGRRHDVQYWRAFQSAPKNPFLRPYGPSITESWIVEVSQVCVCGQLV
jgi:hypothetical protein